MKSILIICDLGHCPHRIPGWADELTLLGWKVFVVSPSMLTKQSEYLGVQKSRDWTLVETKGFPMVYRRYIWLSSRIQRRYEGLFKLRYFLSEKKALRALEKDSVLSKHSEAIRELSHLAWYLRALRDSIKIIKRNDIDVIVSSSSPFLAHVVARASSISTGVPWVADYRDLWSLNHTKKSFANKEISLERDVLLSCKAAITATQGFTKKLSKIFKGEISTIHNAYSTKILENRNFNSEAMLKIVYTGTIYEENQDVSLIMSALSEINQYGIKYKLHVYGYGSRVVEKWCYENLGKIPNYLSLNGHVSVHRARQEQANAELLLCLDWNENIGIETTKLIEYLPLSATIVATGPNQDSRVAEILENSGRGFFFSDVKSLNQFLKEYYTSPRSFSVQGRPQFIKQFSMNHQVSYLNKFLSKLLQAN